MATKSFKPEEITDPMFPFVKDGVDAPFDPWEFGAATEGVSGMQEHADAIRRFLGYPTSQEVATAKAEEREVPRTLSIGQTSAIETAVMEFMANLPDVQKKMQILQKQSRLASGQAS